MNRLRRRLRARRVARLTGWAPGELRGHIEAERAILLTRLVRRMDAVVAHYAVTTETRGMAPALTLHSHTEDQPCGLAATGCSTYPATETVTTMFPPWMDLMADLVAREVAGGKSIALGLPRQHGRSSGILGAIQRDLATYLDGEQGEGSW